MTDIDTAVSKLFDIVARTRSRNPGTSADPYLGALTEWVAVIPEVREVLAPLGDTASVSDVEFVYRDTIESWLCGDPPKDDWLCEGNEATAAMFADEELEHRLREAIDPPAVWIA